ncbi:MAG: glycosyltransferase family 4 protein [Patescibacteria group bacterium]|nr:glycosyltransferase family 4 protein [Patescibacteria group bacterium]
MKIIYITNMRMPTEKAHGIQIMKMCEAFVKNRAEVELIVAKRFNRLLKSIDPFIYYDVNRSFQIKKIFSLDLIPWEKVMGSLGSWIQAFSFYFLASFYLLFKKADLIYSRDSFSLYLLSFFKSNFVYEIHTFPKNFFLHKRILEKANKIIVITEILKNTLIKKGIQKDKILVAPDGVDLEKFNINISKKEAREKLGLPLDKKIILTNSHLYKWKGVQVLADASKFLDKDIFIVFVGGTKEDLEKFRKKNKNLNNILILGHRPYSEMPCYLKSADVLVIPNSGKMDISKSWTSPLKMFEYMASRRPVVASDLPSLREVLSENNAILVEPDNPQELAKGIERALKNTDFSVRISVQAYEDVQKYSWQKRARNILRFILGNE